MYTVAALFHLLSFPFPHPNAFLCLFRHTQGFSSRLDESRHDLLQRPIITQFARLI
jgi:hypothetical protein